MHIWALPQATSNNRSRNRGGGDSGEGGRGEGREERLLIQKWNQNDLNVVLEVHEKSNNHKQ